MELKGSQTEQNLKEAFDTDSGAHERYLYFAQRAASEGHTEVAAAFRTAAAGETSHALGHLEYLEACGDPASGEPFGTTKENLHAAVSSSRQQYVDMYPEMARTARKEGFAEIADWFETLAKAEQAHADHFSRALEELD